MPTMDWIHDHFRRVNTPEGSRRALDRYRMGMKAGGAIRGVRIVGGEGCCPACREVVGIVYHPDEAPALPIARCTHPNGCQCVYRPVMAYED